jgi:hypothetical protein
MSTKGGEMLGNWMRYGHVSALGSSRHMRLGKVGRDAEKVILLLAVSFSQFIWPTAGGRLSDEVKIFRELIFYN